MYYYTSDEKTDMIIIYGESQKNATAAADIYVQRFPNRRHPVPETFRRLETKLPQDHPSHKRSRQRTTTDSNNEMAVFQAVDENPYVGEMELARQIGISKSSVGRILRANKFHPYHLTLVQQLKPTDFPNRIQCSYFMQERLNVDGNFLDKVLFSDESRFSNKNNYTWANQQI
jgi:hypothetical protein